jgi:hypothetical protein
LAPGRRTFQPGETANISVQPAVDSDVTLMVLDRSMHAMARQHVGKEGGVMQIPLPADASGGVYVLATAFTPPDESIGKPVQRSFGLQWLTIDAGAKRMGVRLDSPESGVSGSSVPLKIGLPDLAGKPASVAVIGSEASSPEHPDPVGFFYGEQPIGVTLWDDYGDVIGGENQPTIPDFSFATIPPHQASSVASVWNEPQAARTGATLAAITVPEERDGTRLRLSVIAASEDKIGVAETGLAVTTTPAAPAKSRPAPMPHARLAIVAPHRSLTLRAGQMAYLSTLPIVASPLWIDGKIVPHFESTTDPDTLALVRAASGPPAGVDDLSTMLLLAHDAMVPDETRNTLQARLLEMVIHGTLSDDQKLVAIYALYHGKEVPLWIQAWLVTAKPASGLATLCRFGLLNDDNDLNVLSDDNDKKDEDNTPVIIATMVRQEIAHTIPRLAGVSDDDLSRMSALFFGKTSLSWQDRLGLRAIELTNYTNAAPEALPKLAGKPPEERRAVLKGTATIANDDKRPIHALVLSNWPDAAPE